jgi:hypothetical protein
VSFHLRGGCTLEAIEALCRALDDGEAAIQVLDKVASLIDKSLLQQVEQTNGEPCLMMLETIREFGLDQRPDRRTARRQPAYRQCSRALYLQ